MRAGKRVTRHTSLITNEVISVVAVIIVAIIVVLGVVVPPILRMRSRSSSRRTKITYRRIR